MTARIPLRRRDGSVRSWVTVDADRLEELAGWRWHECSGYARRFEIGTRTPIWMHRELVGAAPGDRSIEVDHRDGNGLNNTAANLRILTRGGNAQNRKATVGSSRYRGVCWHKKDGCWQAAVKVNGRRHYVGWFEDEREAAIAAARFRLEHMPHTVEDEELLRG